MAETTAPGAVLDALLKGLGAQGLGNAAGADRGPVTAYPIRGTVDLVALAEAVENALGGDTSDEQQAKTPAELNAANDG